MQSFFFLNKLNGCQRIERLPPLGPIGSFCWLQIHPGNDSHHLYCGLFLPKSTKQCWANPRINTCCTISPNTSRKALLMQPYYLARPGWTRYRHHHFWRSVNIFNIQNLTFTASFVSYRKLGKDHKRQHFVFRRFWNSQTWKSGSVKKLLTSVLPSYFEIFLKTVISIREYSWWPFSDVWGGWVFYLAKPD